MITHDTKVRVRYAETDQMGYVYYGNYAQYFEIGRVETMRSIGVLYSELEEKHGILMPVLNMHSRFLRPARYDEEITIRTTLRKRPGKNIVFYCEVLNTVGKILCAGRIALCFIDKQTQKQIDTPTFLQEKLAPHFE